MRVVDPALVRAEDPALSQGRDPVHPRQQLPRILAAGLGGSLTARFAGVAELVDAGLALPTVGDDPRAGLDVIGDERV